METLNTSPNWSTETLFRTERVENKLDWLPDTNVNFITLEITTAHQTNALFTKNPKEPASARITD